MWAARLSPGELLAALRHDSGPPLFYLLEKPFAWLAEGGAAEVWLRAIPFAASLLIFGAARTLPRGPARATFSALLAGSLLLNLYAAEARPYALLSLLATALFLIALRGEETRGRLIAATLLSAAALYTHYLAIFCVGAILVLAAASRRLRTCAALGAGAALFAPWVPVLFAQPAEAVSWMQTRESFGPTVAAFLSALGGVGRAPLSFGAPAPRAVFVAGLIAGLFLAALVAAHARRDRETRQAALFALIVLAAVLVADAWRPVAFAGRTEMTVLPIWFWAAARAGESLRPARWTAAAAALSGALATGATLYVPHPVPGQIALSERVVGAARSGDVILAAAGFYLPARLAAERADAPRAEVRALSPDQDAHPGWFVPSFPGAPENSRVAGAAASLGPGGRLFLVVPPTYATEEMGRALQRRPGRARELSRSPDSLVILWTPDPGSAPGAPSAR